MSIIDNVINTVTKEVNKVQSRAQEGIQAFNLANQIKELERKKHAKLAEIGKLVFDKHQNDKEVSDDLLKERCSEISAVEHEISVLQTELDQIKVNHDPDATPTQKAEAKAGYTTSAGFHCQSCGAPANREKAFCPACGESLKSDETASESKKADDGSGEVEVEPEDDLPHTPTI
ncbi:hypothetical protein BH11CYA1_BH11CYA1_36780 [soil metagenome]